jgi:hypothetical protein
MKQNIKSSISVVHLADIAGLGERTFARRFKKATGDTPFEYLQHPMLRFNTFKFSAIPILILCVILIGCEFIKGSAAIKPPQKPPNVPKEAIWSGGVDGGVFILVQKDKNSPANIYFADIYYDSTGEIWYKGRLSIDPLEKPDFDYRNKEVYSGWDGDTLYLKDGRILKAIDTVTTQRDSQ